MTLDDAFVQAIAEQPDDTGLRLIYSDWLEEQGQTDRAAFIRIQCQLAELAPHDPRQSELREREQALLEANWEKWFVPLRAVLERMQAASPRRPCWRPPLPSIFVRLWQLLFGSRPPAACPWHLNYCVECDRGFVESLALSTTEFLAEADALFRAAPLLQELDFFVDSFDGLPQVLACPSLGRLRGLGLFDDTLDPVAVGKLTSCPYLKGVKRLSLSSGGLNADCVAAVVSGELVSQLTELVFFSRYYFREPEAAFGDDAAEALAAADACRNLVLLNLACNRIGDRGAQALARSPHLGSLTTLNLLLNSLGPDGALALVSSTNLRRLALLDLAENQLGDAGAEALASSPGLARLRTLKLRSTGIGDGGARLLADSPHTTGLALLDLSGNHLGEEAQRDLRARFGQRVCL